MIEALSFVSGSVIPDDKWGHGGRTGSRRESGRLGESRERRP